MQRSSSSNMSVMSYGKESSSELQSILSSKVKENEKLRIIIEKLRNEINLLKIIQDSKNQAANNAMANATATTTNNNNNNNNSSSSNSNNNGSLSTVKSSGGSAANNMSRPPSQQQQQRDVTMKTADNNTLVEMETINPMKLSNNLGVELSNADSNGNLFDMASDAKPPKGGKTTAKSKTGKNSTANGTSKKKKEGRANKRQHLSNDAADPAFHAATASSNTSIANANGKNMVSAVPAANSGNGQRSSISHSMLNLSLIENGRPDAGIAAAASGIASGPFVGTNPMADDEEFGILDDRLSSSPSPSLSLTMSNSSEITELDIDSSLLMGSLQSLSPISTNSNSPNFNGGENGSHSEYHDTLLRTALANDTEQQHQQHNGKVSHYLNNNTHHHDPNTLKRLLSNSSVKLERSRSLNSYNGYSNSYNDGSATSHLNSVLRVSQMNSGSSSAAAAAAAAAAISNAEFLSNNEDSDSPAVPGAAPSTKTGAGKKSSKASKSNSSSATVGAGAAAKPKGKTRGRKPKNATTAAASSSKASSKASGATGAAGTAATIANSTGISGGLDMTKVNISNVEKFLDYDPVSDANGIGMDSDLEEAYLRFVRLDDEFSKEFANGGNGGGINDEDDFLTRFYGIDNPSFINASNLNGDYTNSVLENPSVAELKSLKLERSLSVPTYSEPKKTKKPSSTRLRPIKRPTKHFTSNKANSSKPQAKSNISNTKTGGSGKASQMNLNSTKGSDSADGSATVDAVDKESKLQLVPNFEACGFCVDGAPCLCIEAAMELAEANKLTSLASLANDSANNNSSSCLVSEVKSSKNHNGCGNGKSKGKCKGKGNGVKIEVDNGSSINAVDDIASSGVSMDIDTFENNTIGQNDNNNNFSSVNEKSNSNGNGNGNGSGIQRAKVKIEIEERKVPAAAGGGVGASNGHDSKGDVDGDIDMSWFIKQEAD